MRAWDQRAGLLGTGLGIFLIALSLRLDLGSWNQPGPGFLPLLTGIFLAGLCLVYLVSSTMRRDDDYLRKESPWPRENREKIIGVLAALCLYTLSISALGYLFATLLLLIYLFRVLEPGKWSVTLLQAVLTVLATYLVFEKWLMVQFPKGILGV